MAKLVKTCKTFHLSDSLNWRDIKTRVEGVKRIDDRRSVIVFTGSAGKETTLLGYNNSPVVKTCSLYETDDARGNDDDEAAILRALIKASKTKKTYVASLAYDFSVLRVHTDAPIDVFGSYQLLYRMGARVAMDLELHDALLITDDKVVWSISDTVPQKILASVSGVGPSEARGLVNKSRRRIGLF